MSSTADNLVYTKLHIYFGSYRTDACMNQPLHASNPRTYQGLYSPKTRAFSSRALLKPLSSRKYSITVQVMYSSQGTQIKIPSLFIAGNTFPEEGAIIFRILRFFWSRCLPSWAIKIKRIHTYPERLHNSLLPPPLSL